MKQKIRHILILIMATTIFFVGVGVTIVDFCCSDCVEDIFSIGDSNAVGRLAKANAEDHSCCPLEGHSDKDDLACSDHHEEKCCDAERISHDIDHRTYQPDISSPLLLAFLYSFYGYVCNPDNYVADDLSSFAYSDAVPIPPREYLSLIRVLII